MDVHQRLLQEAQEEIAALRADLYNTRRVAEERRQAESTLRQTNAELTAKVAMLARQVDELSAEAGKVQGLQQQLEQQQAACAQLRKDLDISVRARRILDSELSNERQARAGIEAAKAALEADRSQLQRNRDELATQLRIAQRKAQEAEDEQLRAEQEAADLRHEVQGLMAQRSTGQGSFTAAIAQQHAPWGVQRPSLGSRPSGGLDNGIHGSPGDGAHASSHAHTHAASAAKREVQQAMELLETERSRAATLLTSLHEARAEAASLAHQLEALRQTNALLQQQQQQQLVQPLAGTAPAAQPPHPTPPPTAGPPTWSAQGGPALRGHHRHASAVSMAVSETDLSEEQKQLYAQIQKLKASRDKLLEQIDRQWEEMDRLGAENRALGEEAERLKQLMGAWEAQAQGALAAEERLKEMLEEAATWSGGDAKGLHGALIAERARAADLSLQVRALGAELLRAHQGHVVLGKAVLPALAGIEHRLGRIASQGPQPATHLQLAAVGS